MRLFGFLLALQLVHAYNFDPDFDDWNLNKNQYALDPEVCDPFSLSALHTAYQIIARKEYSGEWVGHKFTPSPKNWRFPFYTIMLDRFVNGDPHNDNINKTLFERDTDSTQLRYGGDVAGLTDSLDYIAGMGIKVCCSPLLLATNADQRLQGTVSCWLVLHQLALDLRSILAR